ncbi:hypothetical protein MUCCIDRAFT_107827 [Mucor lusitanicus CBS 277.49]|uniref:Uncharacterized protein n=1 Tax=Mucor lusitanicus CBS 277.49 TaxID=747725 RepID=A0A168P665_MUCCL|nr:hypothetical protein MUCCIDRAFT_107827 [Mucor lusitanicus CBS 277.49]
MVNTVKPYGRYTEDDAHHEHRFLQNLSIFPEAVSRYGLLQVMALNNHNNEEKLIISIRHFNLLVTSSWSDTRIFLNEESVYMANKAVMANKDAHQKA